MGGNLRRFTRTMLAVLVIYFLALLLGLYIAASAQMSDVTRRLAARQAQESVAAGLALLADTRDAEQLRAAANPAFNPSHVFLILLDEKGDVLAAAEGAALPEGVDLSGLNETEPVELAAGRNVLMLGQKGPFGTALAGVSLAAGERVAFSFRALMRVYSLIALGLTLVMLFLLAWRIMQPVDSLVAAAQRVSEGEPARVPEKLPVELRPLGRAITHMSRQLSATIGDLTRERDTLSQVLEGLDEGVLAVDQAGDLLRENQAAVRLLGGRGSAEYARVLSALRASAASPQPDLHLQLGERTLLAVFRPLTARPGALAVLRDVTEAERLERTRREYVANISHELRTPLSGMRGITEGLHDGLVTEEAERQRYYALLLGEVRRLSRLVNDLLELSNLQSSPAAFAIERVDARETLLELHDRTLPLAREKGVALTLSLPPEDAPLPDALTNEDRLQQVLTILLDNAVKFTPEGGEVTLSLRPEGRNLRFSVRDTGIGMDEYTLSHAFDRFHQADPSRKAKGSGLGLAIAREIMQRLGSRIVARSAPGKGSEFSFLIRAQEEETGA